MRFITILFLTLTSTALHVSCANLPNTAGPPVRRTHNVVPRTLQETAPIKKERLGSGNEHSKRASTCSGGENCIDGGCCPAGYNCVGAFTAESGCCPTGHTCSGAPVGCAVSSDVECPGINGCCPTLAQCPSSSSGSCSSANTPAPPPPPPPSTPTITHTTVIETPTTVTVTPTARTVTQTTPNAANTVTFDANTASIDAVPTNPLRNDAIRANDFRMVLGAAMIPAVGILAIWE